jgi:hypothetical protein
LACLLQAELEPDARWAEFLQRCTSSLFELQQSRGAFLTPPGLSGMGFFPRILVRA